MNGDEGERGGPPSLRALVLSADAARARASMARLAEAGLAISADIVETQEAFEESAAAGGYDLVAAERAVSGWIGLLAGRNATGFVLADLDGCVLDANAGLARMLGFTSPQELIGRRTSDFYVPSAINAELLRRLRDEGSLAAVEVKLLRIDGTPIWAIANIASAPGEAVIEATLVEITERRRLQAFRHQLSLAIARIREPGALFEALCRYAVEDGGFRGAAVEVSEDGRARAVARCGEDARAADPSRAIFPLHAGGRLAATLTLYAGSAGFFDGLNLQLCRAAAEDVSFALENMAQEDERRRAEQARAVAGFRELLEAAPDAILETDAAGSILAANAAAERLFQYTREEMLGLSASAILAGDTARRKDKSEFPVEITESRAPSASGGMVTYIVRDITRRRQAEAALLESNRRIRSILESITDAFYALDREWRFTYVNGKAEQMLGRRREDVLGKRIWDEFPELANTGFDQEYRRAAAEQRQVSFTTFDAERKLWAEVHAYPSEDGLAVYLQDITARKLLEERQGRTQRLEALGRLAGGVAHDFNNLLTIIGGYGQMLLDAIDGRSPLRRDVEPIVEAATRASTLTRQLLAFSRRQLVQPKVVDLNRLITKMNKMLRRVIGEDIELKLALRQDLGRTKADPGQIEQVIMNLAINARDAMPSGGVLTLATDNYEPAGEADPSGLPAGACVMLVISDTGEGMDESVQSHLFEPFFTTKARGKGTGLGLSTAYGIIKQSGGEIRVESEPGKGTAFRIYLPRTRKAPKARANAAPRVPRKGTETILLVEDEPQVRTLAREMLARLGYRVLEAGDGAQALEVWRESGDAVDLLVTDVIMPRMSGAELAAALTGMRPELKVLYISGYTDEVIARHGVTHGERAFVAKPFTCDELGLKVRSILDERRVQS
ncbi:MAG: PAS domain S-box protein [Acidobacteriota bacterium]